jgi:hypothetical protein
VSKWRVLYYIDENDVCPVKDFIDSRDIKNQAKILSFIEILEEKGPNLPRPYADILEDGIHELRVKLSGSQIRFLYFFCYAEFIVITHAFTKNTQKVSISEIKKAKKIRQTFLSKYKPDDIWKKL